MAPSPAPAEIRTVVARPPAAISSALASRAKAASRPTKRALVNLAAMAAF